MRKACPLQLHFGWTKVSCCCCFGKKSCPMSSEIKEAGTKTTTKKGQWHQRHQQRRTKIQEHPNVCLEHSLTGNCSLWTRGSCWNWAIVVIIAVVVVVFFFAFVAYNDNALQCNENWKVVKCCRSGSCGNWATKLRQTTTMPLSLNCKTCCL